MLLYDTMHRQKEEMSPIDGKNFRFYCCGPTVYGPAHIGNFRTFVLQDCFRRTLELSGIKTFHVRNLTDVDDKTIRDSQKQNLALNDFTNIWKNRFHADCEALNCLTPHVEPSAVEHIPHQIKMIEELIASNHAYSSDDGSVYFRISSFSEYGKLSHLETRDLELGKTAQQRSNADEYEKDSVADFVLWKSRRPEDGKNFWQSPWGEGRPGWHLECSAMIREYLGTDFDLHSGGVDLVFPHHENEIAQSRCSCGGHFARHWFHITHLLVDGGKMSKSLGNMYTLSDLEKLGHLPSAVRYVLVSGYYRRPLNFTLDSLKDAKTALNRLAKAERELAKKINSNDQKTSNPPSYEDLLELTPPSGPFAKAWESLCDDLNTPEALGHVFLTLKELRNSPENSNEKALQAWLEFHQILASMGIILPNLEETEIEIPAEIQQLAAERWEAKTSRNWALSDELRGKLQELGWTIKDGKDSYEINKL